MNFLSACSLCGILAVFKIGEQEQKAQKIYMSQPSDLGCKCSVVATRFFRLVIVVAGQSLPQQRVIFNSNLRDAAHEPSMSQASLASMEVSVSY